MNYLGDSEEEDNNPFSGTDHLYASGIAEVEVKKGGSETRKGSNVPTNKGSWKTQNAGKKKGKLYKRKQNILGSLEEDPQYYNNSTDNAESLSDAEQRGKSSSVESGSRVVSSSDSSKNDTSSDRSTNSKKVIGEMAIRNGSQYEPYVSLSMSMINSPLKTTHNDTVVIIKAGDFKDPWGKHAIGYVIKHKDEEVIRRYSEFDSLRKGLIKLLPTIVIPAIPSKHSLVKYFLNPINAENDKKIINKRKRMLQYFLNHCYSIEEIREHIVFNKFLDKDYSWKDVLFSPPMSILPSNNLLAPPLNPTKPSPMHLLLPTPTSISKVELMRYPGESRKNGNENSIEIEKEFSRYEDFIGKYKYYLQNIHKSLHQNQTHFKSISKSLSDLGAYYNSLSIENSIISKQKSENNIKLLSASIEGIGHSFDVNYVSTEMLAENLLTIFEEPIEEMTMLLEDAQRVINFRDLKKTQYQIISNTISKRKMRIQSLKSTEEQLKRFENVSQRIATDSPTAASAIKLNKHSSQSSDFSWDQVSEIQESVDNSNDIENSASSPPQSRKKNQQKSRSSGKTSKLEPHLLTPKEREEEIQKLYREVEKLKDCYKLIDKDMQDINNSSLQSIKAVLIFLDRQWITILQNVSEGIYQWLQESLRAWKSVKATIEIVDI